MQKALKFYQTLDNPWLKGFKKILKMTFVKQCSITSVEVEEVQWYLILWKQIILY